MFLHKSLARRKDYWSNSLYLEDPFFIALKDQVTIKPMIDYSIMIFDSHNSPEKNFSNVKKAISKGIQVLLIDPNIYDDVSSFIRLANQKIFLLSLSIELLTKAMLFAILLQIMLEEGKL